MSGSFTPHVGVGNAEVLSSHWRKVKRYRFFNQRRERISKGDSSQVNWLITTTYAADNEAYSCVYWITVLGRQIPSKRSPPVPVPVMDPLPQPVLSVDSPSAVVSEGLPLLITCAAPRNSGEQRFHFYKDEAKIIPGDAGSEISTTEPGTGSLNISVLSIPWAGPNNIGEFTCGYEENMSRRWILSRRSWVVNITRTEMGNGCKERGYNDGAKTFPEDLVSEVNTTESRTCSMNISVLSILWSGSHNTGEFTCEYEENVSGRWILSPRSLAMNVTVSARSFLWVQELVVGGSFLLINGLIFLVSHCCF
ncbi:uncharacterized protein LOC117885529 [Trachemys scripta elegans]|uniref:uncharacterized protein LOC117885529 n=1 Tax=Trachemys scripta elegans TaxID=31138 RepID=UPI00155221E7|nr:uncharacterized protein LOC117885529 [Trachemys scripta elegans]